MNYPTWPEALPRGPLQQGFSFKAVDNVVRTPTELGPAKQRPRATAELQTVQCRLHLSADETAVFRSFHHDTLAQGALRFRWPGLTQWLPGDYEVCQLSAKPQYEVSEARVEGKPCFVVSLSLLAMPQSADA